MKEIFKKGILTGIGIGLMTIDKIKEVANKIAEELKLTEEEARKLAEELIEQSKDTREKINIIIDNQIKTAIEKLNLVSRKDFERLEKKIEELEKKIKQLDK